MDAVLKKSAIILIVVFVGFYLFTDPTGLATFAKEGGDALWNALVTIFEALIRFINALFA